MPNTLLSLPALYTIVGLYRLIGDPNIRNPLWVSWDPCPSNENEVNLQFRRTNAVMEPDVDSFLLQYMYVSLVLRDVWCNWL